MAIDRHLAARTALDLLDDEGLDRLTVRKVASALGVRAPALYWHFESKRALLDQLTDAMLAPAVAGLPAPELPWEEWLEQALGALRQALLAHRDGARVALGADLTRALALGMMVERATEVLHRAGFALGDSSRAAGALVHFVVGRTVEEQARPATAQEAELLGRADFPFPTIAAAMRERHAAGATAQDDFDYSLGIMLAGLRAHRAQDDHRAREGQPRSR